MASLFPHVVRSHWFDQVVPQPFEYAAEVPTAASFTWALRAMPTKSADQATGLTPEHSGFHRHGILDGRNKLGHPPGHETRHQTPGEFDVSLEDLETASIA